MPVAADPITTPTTIAVIGAGGRIAADWRAALQRSSLVRPIAFVESATDARARLEGPPRFADVGTMLRAVVPTAAIVATPPATHEAIATELLAAGVHVLCEKPLALDCASARRMLDAADASRRVLMMASKFRFVDDVSQARQRIGAGGIGRPVFYDNAFCAHVDMRGRWNADPGISGGGVLIDNGAHAVDLARCLLGEIERVFAMPGPRVQDLPVDDSVRVMFESTSGALGRCDLSWSVATGSPIYAAVHGADGSIELGWRSSRQRAGATWNEFGTGYDKLRAFQSQLEHFVGVLRGIELPRIDEHDALQSVRFVAAAARSIATGRWVPLAEADA